MCHFASPLTGAALTACWGGCYLGLLVHAVPLYRLQKGASFSWIHRIPREGTWMDKALHGLNFSPNLLPWPAILV